MLKFNKSPEEITLDDLQRAYPEPGQIIAEERGRPLMPSVYYLPYLKRGMRLLTDRVSYWINGTLRIDRYAVQDPSPENYGGSLELILRFQYKGFEYAHRVGLYDLQRWLEEGDVLPRRIAYRIVSELLYIDIPKCEPVPNPYSRDATE